MRVLALDTATEACSAALLCDGRMVSRELTAGREAAERILSLIEAVLSESGVTLRQLDAIAFGRGPGSFTGVRLAASVAQGLAFSAERPVVAVSDLRALAQQALNADASADAVLVCQDARMQEVYWTYCRRDAEGLAQSIDGERVSVPGEVEIPARTEAAAILGVGSGFRAYPQLGERLAPRLARIEPLRLPRAQEIAALAVVELRGGRTLSPEQALPVYLRDEVASPPSRD
jgi:tRNA threonylcarbamoyladenosine biosynthesis protein TsaB